MTREAKVIAEDILSFQLVDENWDELLSLVEEMFETKNPELGLSAMFSIFEKYPEEYDEAVYWSIVHGVEAIGGYEDELLESIKRTPVEFNLLMINRIINANQTNVGEVNLIELLEEIKNSEKYSEEIRNLAQEYLEYQETRT